MKFIVIYNYYLQKVNLYRKRDFNLKMNLSAKIFIALVLAVILGLILGEENLPWIKAYVAPIGTMFINLIKMIIVPVVLASLVCGVTSLGTLRKLGRIGIKVLALYLCTTAIALVISLVVANIAHPGLSLHLVADKVPDIKTAPSFMEVLVSIIPANPVMSLAKAEMLPIIVFAMALGIGIIASKDKGKPLFNFFDSLADVSYKLIAMIMELAPIGVFTLLLPVVAGNGPKVLLPLLSVIATVYVGCVIHGLIVYSSLVSFFAKMNPLRFFKGITATMLFGFSTCSSAATIPINMKNCEENLGVKKSITSFVLPLGATINMDGTAIYQGVCAIFIANVYGIDLTLSQMVLIVLTGTLSSIGTAGVPGAGLIMLALILQTVGLPMEGLALVAGIDRILDMIRTCLNVTGDAAVTVSVNATEKDVVDDF